MRWGKEFMYGEYREGGRLCGEWECARECMRENTGIVSMRMEEGKHEKGLWDEERTSVN
jgi:hypothetical protein